MKRLLLLLVISVVTSFTCFRVNAQINAGFQIRDGYNYAVLANSGSYTTYVEWWCVNRQTGESIYGNINLLPGYETCIGPNRGWYWREGEEFVYRVSGEGQYNISFGARKKYGGPATPPNDRSDGMSKVHNKTVRKYGYTYPVYKDKYGNYWIYDRNARWMKVS